MLRRVLTVQTSNCSPNVSLAGVCVCVRVRACVRARVRVCVFFFYKEKLLRFCTAYLTPDNPVASLCTT